jgi:hypothetical protein
MVFTAQVATLSAMKICTGMAQKGRLHKDQPTASIPLEFLCSYSFSLVRTEFEQELTHVYKTTAASLSRNIFREQSMNRAPNIKQECGAGKKKINSARYRYRAIT